ncbi:MAG: sulfatase [Betaproteobacteria bacterium]|nr:sulfatase [Betaproteobacteria bacterium]
MTTQPNFLFIITDQQRADHLGCYGNPVLRTPHIDTIAARGVRFERFFVANPICMPNRATIMTGRMPTLHGVRHNGIPLSHDQTTFVERLRAEGYQTALIGKSHLQNFTRDDVKFARQFEPGLRPPPDGLTDAYHELLQGPDYDHEQPLDWLADPTPQVGLPFYGFDHVELCTWHGDMVQGHYSRWLQDKDPQAFAQWGPEHSETVPGYAAPQARRPRVPPELYPSSYIAERSVAWLEQHARNASAQPFFMQCSFPDPHHPFTPPGRYWDMYDPERIQLPPSFYKPSIGQVPMMKEVHAAFANGTAKRDWVGVYAVNEAEAKRITALTYGMIGLIDDCVGKMLASLESLGLAKNTVVVFTSDHGDWMADHGLMQKGPLHYRGLIRVPFLWSDPVAPRPGSSTTALAGTIDIARSILHRAGLAPHNGMQGQALGRIVDEGRPSQHDGMIIEQTTQRPMPGFDRPARIRSFVDEDWRITLWSGWERGELYDLSSDPHEQNNLWDVERHKEKKTELMQRMLVKMIELQDWAPRQMQEA